MMKNPSPLYLSAAAEGNGEDFSGDYVFNFFEPSILFSIKFHWRRTLVQR
jgi:hypothetical protein